MSLSLGLLLYLALGLALVLLRISQGVRPGDALFGGLFWPLDHMRAWVEVLMRGLFGQGWEKRECLPMGFGSNEP